MKKVLLTLAAMAGISSLSAQDAYVRFPALSPDGQKLAFSYQGDIWLMDNALAPARRLTVHEAYESMVLFSPNGESLAFNSNRFGNNDIFTLSFNGGSPKRLTYHSASDGLSDWNAKQGILFDSERSFVTVEWDKEIHSVSAQGGTPQRILDAVGEMPVASPSGRYIAFTRGACRITRENYVGPADNEVWIYDTQTKQYTQLTDNEVNDIYPQWRSEEELIILSAKDGRYNLQSIQRSSGEKSWLTNFNDEGIHYFRLGGEQIVYNRGSQVFWGNLSDAQSLSPMKLTLGGDSHFYDQKRESYSSGISSYSLSPDNKLALLEIHGELFVTEIDEDESRSVNLSKHPYYDREGVFLNEETIHFSSDRSGTGYDFYTTVSSDPKKKGLYESLRHKTAASTESKLDLREATLSPDRKKIAYLEGGTKLMIADIDEKGKLSNSFALMEAWHGASGLSWSPDGRFLAYHHDDLNFNSEVYIHEVKKGATSHNISMHPGNDYGATWSADGSKLGFISDRSGRDADVWFLWLQREKWLAAQEELEEGYYFDEPAEEDEDEDEDKDDKKDKKKEKKVEPVQIDFADIHDRLQQVTSFSGSEGNVLISKDGETFYFTRYDRLKKGSDIYQVKYDGSDLEALTKSGLSPNNLQWDKDYKGFYCLSRGKLKHIKAKGGKSTSYPHMAKMTIDKKAEREQVFEEAWRLINTRFYDPQFHGEDWKALKAKYKPWAMAASTDQDFSFIYNLMLGRLNASHMGLYGSGEEEVTRESTGRLGIEVAMKKGGAEVTRVVALSPADRSKNNLQVGDLITEVNGLPVKPSDNFYAHLAETASEPVLMKVKRKSGGSEEIVIRPSRFIGSELYEEWVRGRKELVEKYSEGRLGYIHIRGMDMPSFERFERELMASGHGKEGIVIDVRFNGGGWTTDYLMAVLNVRQHAYTVPRGAAKNLAKEHPNFANYYPYSERLPLAAWTKPSIAMCNQNSYSNAEIFSHAYKSLGLGTLVGQPTFGAVISTGGSRLLNGSFVRLPFRGWYVKNSGMNMENGPAVPDILVENPPASRAQGEDLQLKTAVNELLKQIDAKP